MGDYEKMLDRARAALPEKTLTFERFETPAIESFLQGNKTIVRNFDVILQKIRRPPEMLARYFSKELAIPASVEGSKLVLNGKFYDRNLKEKLQAFVDAAVVCKECKRPDTKITEREGIKTLVCEACGARAPVKI
ncbi:TPA: translation initiation factor IF-2 subunit beta [Candidatus Micrarchaeota archaeon]|nr:translation initiation factor IF-2 subunit beta [Candidatus Micrarchaeota archaeon]HIH30569.1 translation initiation factor IF-2 subunit beta [Candidatus Micrarchaeota archaeon]